MTDDLRSEDPEPIVAAAAVDEIVELTRAVRELRMRMEEGQRQVLALAPDVAASLDAVADRLETGARGVGELAEAVASAVREELERAAAGNEEWQAVHEQLEERIGGLAEALSGLEERTGSLVTEAAALEEALGETIAMSSAAVEEMKERIAEAEEVLVESLEEADDSLQEFVSALTDKLDETAEAIEDLMEATVEDVGERLDEAMKTVLSAVTESLEELAELIADQTVPAMAQEVAADLVKDLTAVIDDLLAGFREVLGDLRQSLFEGTEQTGQSRAAVEAALDQLQFLLDPIQTEIGRIRGLASSVGIGI